MPVASGCSALRGQHNRVTLEAEWNRCDIQLNTFSLNVWCDALSAYFACANSCVGLAALDAIT